MLLGIIGAFVGGTVWDLLTTGTLSLTATSLSLGGIILAVQGAIIVLFIYYAIASRRTTL